MEQFNLSIVRVCVIGNVDAGKSTLIGVLAKGILDTGKGEARKFIFNSKHEKETGRTSQITHEILCFDQTGSQVLPEHFTQDRKHFWKQIVPKSHKLVQLIDLCGHECYLKTTINGLTSSKPNYSIVVAGANMTLENERITHEHIMLTLFNKGQPIVVFNKVDLAQEEVYNRNKEWMVNTIKRYTQRNPKLMKNENLKQFAANMRASKITPIFEVSCKTGQGINELREFLYYLQNNDTELGFNENRPLKMTVNETFKVHGLNGIIAFGLIEQGRVKLGQEIYKGPWQWKKAIVKQIEVYRMQVPECKAGYFACLLVESASKEKLERKDFAKGTFLVDQQSIGLKPTIEFMANIALLHIPTFVRENYKPFLHCSNIKHPVCLTEIVSIKGKPYREQKQLDLQAHQQQQLEPQQQLQQQQLPQQQQQDQMAQKGEPVQEGLKSKDTATVKLRFLQTPQFLEKGDRFVLREKECRIFGTVTHLFMEPE